MPGIVSTAPADVVRRGVVVLVAISLLACRGAGDEAVAYNRARPLFVFADAEIVESSGFAASSRSGSNYYTHNDSGDSARFFVVDRRGCTVVRYTIGGARAIDWEDMTRGPGPSGRSTLWFGDIGDNAATRPFVSVYAVAEPPPPPNATGACSEPRAQRVSGTRFDFVYPDGPHDAEALFAHPRTGRLYVVTKGADGAQLFGAPAALASGRKNVLTHLGTLDLTLATGAAMAPDGKSVVVRTYTTAYEWRDVQGDVGAAMRRAPVAVSLPSQLQGEAIAYRRDGKALLITSEEPVPVDQPVYELARDGD